MFLEIGLLFIKGAIILAINTIVNYYTLYITIYLLFKVTSAVG